jgi:hypothetical protein
MIIRLLIILAELALSGALALVLWRRLALVRWRGIALLAYLLKLTTDPREKG